MAALPSPLGLLEGGILGNEGGTSAAGYGLNNPYDIEDANGNLVSYPSLEAGYQAGENQIISDSSGGSSIYSPSESLSQFITTFTGGNPNAPSNVGSLSGLNMNAPLSSVAPSATPSSSSSSWWSDFANLLNGTPAGMAANVPTSPAGTTAVTAAASGTLLSTLFSSRFAIGIIGLIILGAGAFMLSISGIEGALQSEPAKAVKKAAALAAA